MLRYLITITLLIHKVLGSNSSSFPTLDIWSTNGLNYKINATFGSDNQHNDLRVDLAQPYLWVLNDYIFNECLPNGTDPINSEYASTATEMIYPCVTQGVYNYTDSNSSEVDRDDWYRLTFLDYVIVNGTTVGDKLIIPNVDNFINESITVKSVKFLNANDSNTAVGAFGLSSVLDSDPLNDTNLLDSLKLNNVINSSSFSLIHQNNYSGSLVLGGLNRDHFIEPLVKFNKVPYLNEKTNTLQTNFPIVPLDSISVSNSRGKTLRITESNSTFPILLDSRATFTFLPYDLVIDLAVQLNAYYSSSVDAWFTKCDITNINATLDFGFGNLTIKAPLSDFITQLYSDEDSSIPTKFDDGDDACLLLVYPNYLYGYPILGTNFLKSAFIAVDNEGDTIALAQANNDFWSSYSPYTSISSTSTVSDSQREIKSNYIPFAKNSNITQSLTFSFQTDETISTTAIPPDISALVSSNTIYTGGRIPTDSNSTITSGSTSTNGSSTTSNGISYALNHTPFISLGLLLLLLVVSSCVLV